MTVPPISTSSISAPRDWRRARGPSESTSTMGWGSAPSPSDCESRRREGVAPRDSGDSEAAVSRTKRPHPRRVLRDRKRPAAARWAHSVTQEQHPVSCSHRVQQVSAAAELAIDDDLSDVVHVAPLVEELPREGSADEIVEVERWTTERHEGARGKAREPDD